MMVIARQRMQWHCICSTFYAKPAIPSSRFPSSRKPNKKKRMGSHLDQVWQITNSKILFRAGSDCFFQIKMAFSPSTNSEVKSTFHYSSRFDYEKKKVRLGWASLSLMLWLARKFSPFTNGISRKTVHY